MIEKDLKRLCLDLMTFKNPDNIEDVLTTSILSDRTMLKNMASYDKDALV